MQRLKKTEEQAGGATEFYDKNYNAEDLHKDLEKGIKCGCYGSNNSSMFALSEVKHNIDLDKAVKTNQANPLHNEDLDFLLKQPSVRRHWAKCVAIDPMGMYATRPTISGTKGCMRMEELRDVHRDGKVVNADGSVNIMKAAVDPVWNLPGLAKRLGMPEDKIRQSIFKYTNNPEVLDKSKRAYLPNIGGTTMYFFGDAKKLADSKTETCVRVHDECNGSDVFGTDICTCRPYLIFAIQSAIQCAQRGGVGVIAYYRKEGRSLGEVTKFRVYNARKNQEGGDRPEMYFYQTESIAGIRDARFQELMPDPLVLLGITRIDWLVSMSSDKYDAIRAAGIQVMQRISLPDEFIPDGASVEINAKIAAGYHTDQVDTQEIALNMWNLDLVRDQAKRVFELAKADKLMWGLDESKLGDAVHAVVECIKEYYPSLNIPHHSRQRHYELAGSNFLAPVTDAWNCDKIEKARRMVDLMVVSSLLDAGAGREWKYFYEKNRAIYSRSEGLAIAVLDMFCDGVFSSDPAVPHRVNSHALQKLETKTINKGFQVSEKNPMVGLAGRTNMLNRLGSVLDANPAFFGAECARPGNMVDYVLKNSTNGRCDVKVLWKVLTEGLAGMWPTRTVGARRGDVWTHNQLKEMGHPGSDLVPFHKLLQWLAYSLIEPFQEFGIKFDNLDLLTPLAEYRNGGLLVDAGVIYPKDKTALSMQFDVGSEFVVEWRALTINLIDKVADGVRKEFGKTKEELPLSQVLEGGTWRSGRQLAQRLRPPFAESPIAVRSDGTVF